MIKSTGGRKSTGWWDNMQWLWMVDRWVHDMVGMGRMVGMVGAVEKIEGI